MAWIWSEDELLLVLDFYIRVPRCTRSNPELDLLARRLGRSVGSIYARLQNYKAVDPDYLGIGLAAGIGVCKPIWDRYAERLRLGESVEDIILNLVREREKSWYGIVLQQVIHRWGNGQTFSLGDVYELEGKLAQHFPENAHIKEKIRQTLQKLRDAGELEFTDNNGSYKVKYSTAGNLYPDEIGPAPIRKEGSILRVEVNAYERNVTARRDCIRQHGCSCFVCNMSFAERYGVIGEGFIHVHHLKPLASIGAEYVIDPVHDLAPVCPNCHAMLHRQSPPISIEELRELFAGRER